MALERAACRGRTQGGRGRRCGVAPTAAVQEGEGCPGARLGGTAEGGDGRTGWAVGVGWRLGGWRRRGAEEAGAVGVGQHLRRALRRLAGSGGCLEDLEDAGELAVDVREAISEGEDLLYPSTNTLCKTDAGRVVRPVRDRRRGPLHGPSGGGLACGRLGRRGRGRPGGGHLVGSVRRHARRGVRLVHARARPRRRGVRLVRRRNGDVERARAVDAVGELAYEHDATDVGDERGRVEQRERARAELRRRLRQRRLRRDRRGAGPGHRRQRGGRWRQWACVTHHRRREHVGEA